MTTEEWYMDNMQQDHNRKMGNKSAALDNAKIKLAKPASRSNKNKARSGLAAATNAINSELQALKDKQSEYAELTKMVAERTCGCPPLTPSPPCDVHYQKAPLGSPEREKRTTKVASDYREWKEGHLFPDPNFVGPRQKVPSSIAGLGDGSKAKGEHQQVNHLTPKSAGGCPTGDGNLQQHRKLCDDCQALDTLYGPFQ